MSDVITKRSEEFKELTDWMVQTTREIETAMKHLRPTIGQEHYLTGDEICRRFHVCKRTLQTLRDTKAIPYTTLGGKILYPESGIFEVLKKNYRVRLGLSLFGKQPGRRLCEFIQIADALRKKTYVFLHLVGG